MVAKEWREARWKFTLGVISILALGTLVVLPYEQVAGSTAVIPNITGDAPMPEGFPRHLSPEESAMSSLSGAFGTAGGYVLVPLAVLLGTVLVSGEVGRGTIFLLLAKPIGRTRLLLIKYGVGATVLLAVALIGGAGLFVSSWVRGYPPDQFSIIGVTLSAVLLWLGVLFVLGTALLMSVLFRNVIASVAATVLALYLALPLGGWIDVISYNLFYSEYPPPDRWYDLVYSLNLTVYWTSGTLYMGKDLAVMNFLICFIAAAVPLLAALWLFNRKAY